MVRPRLLPLAILVFGVVFLTGVAAAATADLKFKVTGLGLPDGISSVIAVSGLNNLGDVVGSSTT